MGGSSLWRSWLESWTNFSCFSLVGFLNNSCCGLLLGRFIAWVVLSTCLHLWIWRLLLDFCLFNYYCLLGILTGCSCFYIFSTCICTTCNALFVLRLCVESEPDPWLFIIVFAHIAIILIIIQVVEQCYPLLVSPRWVQTTVEECFLRYWNTANFHFITTKTLNYYHHFVFAFRSWEWYFDKVLSRRKNQYIQQHLSNWNIDA